MQILSGATIPVVAERGFEHWQQARRHNVPSVLRGINQEYRKVEKSVQGIEQAAQCHREQARDRQIARVTVEERCIQRQARQRDHVLLATRRSRTVDA